MIGIGSMRPPGITNNGNTCFIASYLQLVCGDANFKAALIADCGLGAGGPRFRDHQQTSLAVSFSAVLSALTPQVVSSKISRSNVLIPFLADLATFDQQYILHASGRGRQCCAVELFDIVGSNLFLFSDFVPFSTELATAFDDRAKQLKYRRTFQGRAEAAVMTEVQAVLNDISVEWIARSVGGVSSLFTVSSCSNQANCMCIALQELCANALSTQTAYLIT